jgi:hypothetical protein
VKDVRRHREDNTIEVVAQWRFHDQMTALSEPQFEAAIQIALTKAGFAKNATPYFGEWFKVRWPMAVDLVEQCAVLLQPLYGAPFLQRAGLAP